MMKKLICFICALSAAMALAACGSTDSSSAVKEEASEVQTYAAKAEEEEEEESEDDSPYTLNGVFTKQPSSKKWEISHGWTNGSMFNCYWDKKEVAFEDGVMKLSIDKNWDDTYLGAEFRTTDFYGYGLYEVSMKPIKNVGVVSSFFTYTGPSDGNPWDEIDIEFLGKDTTKVQFNYFTNGKGNHEKLYDLGYDASESFHTYGFRWAKDSITWYVDGKEVHKAEVSIPVTPSKIMMNTWNGKGVDSWLGKYDGTTPLHAEYQWARFTAE